MRIHFIVYFLFLQKFFFNVSRKRDDHRPIKLASVLWFLVTRISVDVEGPRFVQSENIKRAPELGQDYDEQKGKVSPVSKSSKINSNFFLHKQ